MNKQAVSHRPVMSSWGNSFEMYLYANSLSPLSDSTNGCSCPALCRSQTNPAWPHHQVAETQRWGHELDTLLSALLFYALKSWTELVIRQLWQSSTEATENVLNLLLSTQLSLQLHKDQMAWSTALELHTSSSTKSTPCCWKLQYCVI